MRLQHYIGVGGLLELIETSIMYTKCDLLLNSTHHDDFNFDPHEFLKKENKCEECEAMACLDLLAGEY